MEDTLRQLAKEIVTPKFGAIKNSCNKALSVLQDAEAIRTTEAWQLREICLEPLQMALESRAKKLSYHALAGIQHICRDERFHSSLEVGEEERWLPVQVLNTLYMTPYLPDDIQVEIMKLLLNMTLTTAWCMNAHMVTKISQVDDGDDMLADFKATARSVDVESVMEEVVALLRFLIHKLQETQSNMGRQVVPLLLEGVHAILTKLPVATRHNTQFQEIVWKHLCPLLVSLLGAPKSGEELGRGAGRASSSGQSNLGPAAAKVIYSIAAELVRLVGGVGSLRPVLESLFHRILLYPPPQQRADALKIVKELLNNPERLVDMTAPIPGSGGKADGTEMIFIKMILEAVQESCHCNEFSVCFTSVTCVDALLHSLDALSHGQGISDAVLDDIQRVRGELEKAQTAASVTKQSPAKRGMCGSHRDSDGGSVNASSTADRVDLSPPDSPRPVVDSDTNSEASFSDTTLGTVQRVTRIKLTDVDAEEVDAKMSTSEVQKSSKGDEESTEGDSTGPAAGVCVEGDVKTEIGDSSGDTAHRSVEVVDRSQVVEGSETVGPHSQAGRDWGDVDMGDKQTHRQVHGGEDEARQKHKLLRDELCRLERESAGKCVRQIRSQANTLLSLSFVTDVDEALQGFASNFCAGLSQHQLSETSPCVGGQSNVSPSVVLNADGVYTATVAALQLTYKLTKSGYYTDRQPQLLTVSQREFVDGVLGSGLLLYLSPTWLGEVYSQTVTAPLMDSAHHITADCSLLQMLKDLDGLGSHEVGGQLMSDYRCQDDGEWRGGAAPQEPQLKVEAGQFLAQRVLSWCWEGILDVLSVLLEGKSSCGISFSLGLLLGTEGAREETQRARDAICLSLSGLQTASRLCCTLGLQSRCGSAFAQLANTSCVREDMRLQAANQREGKGALKATVLRERPKPVRLHAAHVLSMDVVMTTGLEVGSHAADCWKHVFRCCAHISELEHTYFSRGNHQSSLPRIQHGQDTDTEGNTETDSSGGAGDLFDSPVMTVAAVPVAPRINVVELIKQSSMESGWETSLTGGGVLTPAQAARALCGLSQEVDSLFEDAARKLNLVALLSFLTELSESSRQQLHQLQHLMDTPDTHTPLTLAGAQGSRLPTNALHLYRLQEALMTVVHSSRPLLHLVRVWAAVAQYLVEATGHQDRTISKMAVTCIHDYIVAMLSTHPELPHFHVNEFLCKTFEDMLCLELCDSDVQDQIVCSICELVEACTEELQSGWRPLFGALRSVRIEFTANEQVNEARQRHVAAVLDVFEVYLNTDNILVFANATVDCILCLLKYVHGPGMFEDVYEDDGSDSGSDVCVGGMSMDNLCIPALGYLARCSHILASMWRMPQCPAFKGAFRIEQGPSLRMVDPKIPHMCIEPLDHAFLSATYTCARDGHSHLSAKGDQRADSHSITSVDSGMLDSAVTEEKEGENDGRDGPASLHISPPSLSELDRGSGVLHVWYLLLDGLATAIASCPRSFQPQTLTTLFELLRDTADVPGPKFSLYCVNHLLLPMLQSWLRRGSRLHGYWDTGTVNFKQCCGLAADLVVDFISKFVGQSNEIWNLELMLRQVFDVLTECVAQPVENLSLLGCSCIRHVLLSVGPVLTEPMWNISAQCLAHAVTVTTYNLSQLMALFHPNSDNFYGDIGQVKVATRKDCVAMDSMRLRQLSRQVFLLDSQVTSMPLLNYDTEEDKSYIFLLYSPEHLDSIHAEHIMARVPFRDMVVGLLSNQLLIQTLGALLLDGANSKTETSTITSAMPGLLRYMSTRNVLSFLDILESMFNLSCQFDARPGLKFLLQKVAGLEVAANQYRSAAATMVMYLHTLTHLASRLDGLDLGRVQDVLVQRLDGEDTHAHNKVLAQGTSSGDMVSTDSQDVEPTPWESVLTEKRLGDVTRQKSDVTDTEMTKHAANSVPIAVTNFTTNAGPRDIAPAAGQSGPNLWKEAGQFSTAKPWDSADVFLPLLYEKCLAVCQKYADIIAESDTESLVDRMASRPLFFLVAQPEDIGEMTESLKRRSKEERRKYEAARRRGKGGGVEGAAPGLVIATMETVQDLQAGVEETGDQSDSDREQNRRKSSQASGRSENDENEDDDALRWCSKRQLRADHESKVYSVATDNVIQTLIGQYKKHKQQNAMPNTLVQFARRHRPTVTKVPRREPVDEAINKQQQVSIMKDSEAHQRSWSEMLVTVLQLFLQLPDAQFMALLPATSTSVTHLVCYAHDTVLRDTLAQWFQRLGRLYGFAPKFKHTAKTGGTHS